MAGEAGGALLFGVATGRACPELVVQYSVAGSALRWHQEA